MKRRFYRRIFAFLFFAITVLAMAQEELDPQINRISTLLAGYLANDLTFQKATINEQLALLSCNSARINNGMAFSISSGTITVYANGNGTNVEIKPNATLSIPTANDTTVSASVPLTFQNGGIATEETSTVSSNEVSMKDASVTVSTGIITGVPLTKKITVLEAERKYLEARRNAQDAAITAEKDFYTALKKLYNYAVSVLTKRSNLYDDTLDLKKLVAQGYSKTASSYLKADLKVRSDQRDVTEAERLLERETAVFAKKCGLTYEKTSESAYENALAFLPFSIPEVEILDPKSFPEEAYSASETAAWNKYIAELKRKANKNLTLKANVGYTFNNSKSSSDTVDAGLSMDWRGFSATAGVSFATGNTVFSSSSKSSDSSDPVYKFSFGWSPNTWRLSKITEQQNQLNRMLEDVTIKNAENEYETTMAGKITTISDLQWSKQSYQEEYAMYEQVEKDMAKWYKQGIVTENDWLDSRDNRQKAQINLLINAIDVILFNDETKLLFHTDEGIVPSGGEDASLTGKVDPATEVEKAT
ncbi:MAG: hypothetical protein IJP62_07300 [Treponema sp.]|nr:hypothetical protein [Treponema sp.]